PADPNCHRPVLPIALVTQAKVPSKLIQHLQLAARGPALVLVQKPIDLGSSYQDLTADPDDLQEAATPPPMKGPRADAEHLSHLGDRKCESIRCRHADVAGSSGATHGEAPVGLETDR